MSFHRSTACLFNALSVTALIGCADAHAADLSEYYSTSSAPQSWANSNAAWMKDIADDRHLSELSIPGTHDSASLYGGDLVETQSWSLREQLDAGVRFLDIRCRHIEDVFTIHHGRVYQNINFGDVIQTVREFLDAHPTETVVMRVKAEYDPENNTRSFASTYLDRYVDPDPHLWYRESSIPTLGAVRRKIVLLTEEAGIDGIGWGTLDMQDDYSVPTTFDIPAKWSAVKAQLDDARAGNLDTWYVNFSSGAGGGAYPYTIARSVNESLFDALESTGRVGTIVMDYPGERLIDRIISKNFETTTYDVVVETGQESGSGTDANIFLNITGSRGSTGEVRLNGLVSGNAFETGSFDSFHLEAVRDVGTITSITLRSDDKYAGSAWYFASVKVTPSGKSPIHLGYYGWLEDDRLSVTVQP